MLRIEVQEWNAGLEASFSRVNSERGQGHGLASHRGWLPKVDLLESNRSLLLRVDLSGVSLKRVQILLSRERKTLTVRGVRLDDIANLQEKFRPLILEIEEGEFSREIPLPDVQYHIEDAQVQLIDGILSVLIPKERKIQTAILIEESITIKPLL